MNRPALVELLDDALQATREAYRNAPTVQSAALIKDAENALYGAAKIVCAERPLPLRSIADGEASPRNALVDHRIAMAHDWRKLALDWERYRDTALSAKEQGYAEKQMQHALLMAENAEQRASELEKGGAS